jgi:hypothetical protein
VFFPVAFSIAGAAGYARRRLAIVCHAPGKKLFWAIAIIIPLGYVALLSWLKNLEKQGKEAKAFPCG